MVLRYLDCVGSYHLAVDLLIIHYLRATGSRGLSLPLLTVYLRRHDLSLGVMRVHLATPTSVCIYEFLGSLSSCSGCVSIGIINRCISVWRTILLQYRICRLLVLFLLLDSILLRVVLTLLMHF